jgi:hypothetical protein
MKREPGRPKLPKGEAKGKIVPVRFTKAEAARLAKAAEASDQNVSEWIRRAVLAALGDERFCSKP